MTLKWKTFWESVGIWQGYREFKGGNFFRHSVYDYTIVRPKTSWSGLLICRTYQHYHRQWLFCSVVTCETKHWSNFEIISKQFYFTCNHGITWCQVRESTSGQMWICVTACIESVFSQVRVHDGYNKQKFDELYLLLCALTVQRTWRWSWKTRRRKNRHLPPTCTWVAYWFNARLAASQVLTTPRRSVKLCLHAVVEAENCSCHCNKNNSNNLIYKVPVRRRTSVALANDRPEDDRRTAGAVHEKVATMFRARPRGLTQPLPRPRLFRLTVTGDGSIGKCGRLSQPSWLLVLTII